MDEKYTPYNHKGTKIDGVEPKHRGIPTTKRRECLISHELYVKFNHINTLNSFRKLIEKRLQKYKGVASKYINRYNALFVMQRETQEMDNTEKLQYVLFRLKNIYKITRFMKKNFYLIVYNYLIVNF
ncbi:hypothetical protein [Holdemanella porci]|uniref:hypothetical protein n=1 Tax=Holdemanella porci TaxID=2652276 RepID=UPI002941E049|nr:hypothetical protein [Holdemanella porci]